MDALQRFRLDVVRQMRDKATDLLRQAGPADPMHRNSPAYQPTRIRRRRLRDVLMLQAQDLRELADCWESDGLPAGYSATLRRDYGILA